MIHFHPWQLTFVGVTGLAIAFSTGLSDRPSHAQSPNDFVPENLDCSDPQGTPEFNYCAQLDYEAADTELNQVYDELKGQLDPEGQEKLTDAELAWLDYRDAHCDFEVRDIVGATGYAAYLNDCLARITKQRTEELKLQMRLMI